MVSSFFPKVLPFPKLKNKLAGILQCWLMTHFWHYVDSRQLVFQLHWAPLVARSPYQSAGPSVPFPASVSTPLELSLQHGHGILVLEWNIKLCIFIKMLCLFETTYQQNATSMFFFLIIVNRRILRFTLKISGQEIWKELCGTDHL